MNRLEDYTKDEILVAIKQTWKCGEKLLRDLPIIKYNRMCDEAQTVGNEASAALNNNDIKKASELFDKSNKLWEDANSFIDKVSNNREVRDK